MNVFFLEYLHLNMKTGISAWWPAGLHLGPASSYPHEHHQALFLVLCLFKNTFTRKLPSSDLKRQAFLSWHSEWALGVGPGAPPPSDLSHSGQRAPLHSSVYL